MIDRIAKLLRINEGEIQRRLALINLSQEEISTLKALSSELSREDVEKLFNELYRYLLSFREIREILGGEEGLVEDLKKVQVKHFRELLGGNYDLDYALSRLRVGYVHESVGVEPKFYTGAFVKLIELLIPMVREKVGREKFANALLALFKAVILDITLSIDAYLFSRVLKGRSERYEAVLNSVRDAILVVDAKTLRIVEVNRSALDLIGVNDKDELVGTHLMEILPSGLRTVAEEKLKDFMRGGKGITEVIYLEHRHSGELIPMEVSLGSFSVDGNSYLVGVFRDIRERLKREEVIRRLNRLYGALSRINILVTTLLDEEELFSSAVRVIREGGFRYVGVFRKGEEGALAEDGLFFREQTSACIPLEESPFYILVSREAEESFTREEVELLREVTHDLSFGLKKIRMEERISHLEMYDEVTMIPNRRFFMKKLAESIDRAKRDRTRMALLLMDVDNLTELNEAFGHESVDRFLRDLASRIKKLIRGSDFMGRIGADEFGIIVLSEDAKNAVDRLLDRIRSAVSRPFKIDSQEVYVTLSYGVSFFPEDVESSERLFSNASYSLQRAKELGGNRTVHYSETVKRATLEKVRLRSDLRRALEREEFLLYYQPKIDLRSGKVIGAEALIRWNKDGRIVPPARFIPVLEESELIQEVGEWVLREACRQAEEWREKGIRVPVAVNVSPVQLKAPFFVENLYLLLSEYGKGCECLEIEITESAAMEDVEKLIEIVKTLSSRGIKTYIDDFGTGYSSLAYLKKLPVYALKIDRTFVKDIPSDRDDLEIVKATLLLAHTFGLKTVAEGVETEEQARILRELGCDFAQGYYFGKPMQVQEFERLIEG